MTDQGSTPTTTQAEADVRQARIAALAAARSTAGPSTAGRSTKRRRHPAQGARIAAAGLGTTALFGLVGAMAVARPPTPAAAASAAQPQLVVVIHRTGAADTVATTAGPPTGTGAGTPLTARPTVRQASPVAQTPAASTRGSR